jgi:tRNA (guanine-N7-)-methyltransferase
MYWNFTGMIAGPQDAHFGGAAKTAVEIGFGNGEYLQHLSASGRYSLVIGIEVSQWCVTKAARRAIANGSENVRLMCGDARYLFKYAFEPESVTDVFMNFPCPWPKRRHAERRVARDDFAELLAAFIAPGGAFTLATDVGWYANDTRDVFASCGSFETEPVIQNPERGYVTKYERKWRAMGRETYQLRAVKTKSGINSFTDTGDDYMTENTEIICDALGDFREKVSSLTGDIVEKPGCMAMFREIFRSGDDAALVKVISIDEGFEQHYYLKITNSGGRVRVMTDSVGHPYKSPSVSAAIKHASSKLAG